MTRVRFLLMMSSLILVEALASLETSMIFSATGSILREYKSVTALGWLLSSYALVQALSAAVVSPLGDIYGRRRILLAVVICCLVGSVISAWSETLELVVIGRTLQGASGAILPLCYGITRDVARQGTAPFWIGVMTGVYAAAAGVGYILGGYLSDSGSWRSIFVFSSAYAAFMIPLVLFTLPKDLDNSKQRRPFDFVGAGLFVPAISATLVGLTMAKDWGWADIRVAGSIGGGLVVLAYWAWYESRQTHPLIDVKLLRRPNVAIGNLCAALVGMGALQLPFVGLLLLQQPKIAGVGLAVSATVAGLLKLPSNFSALIASPLSGWIASKQGARWAALYGGLIAAAGWALMIFLNQDVAGMTFCIMVAAFGATMLLAALPNLVLEGSPASRSSEVTGLVSVNRALSLGIGAQLMTALLGTSQVSDHTSGVLYPSRSAYTLTFIAVAILCLAIALAASWLIISDMRKRHRDSKALPDGEPQ